LLIVTDQSLQSLFLRCEKSFEKNRMSAVCREAFITESSKSELVFNQKDQINVIERVVLIAPKYSDNLTNFSTEDVLEIFPNMIDLEIILFQLKSFEFDEVLSKLHVLMISSAGLESFKSNLNTTAQLICLDLYINNIKRLDDNAFAGMNNLKNLFLTMNKITQLNSKIFQHLKSLNCLILSGNRIKRLDLEFYQALSTSLEKFWLDDNELTEIPEKAFESLPKLTKLRMNDNFLKSFVISDSKLIKLWLIGNKISELNMGNTSTLTELYIEKNYLHTLSSSMFSEIHKMFGFSFVNNKIEAIDQKVMKKLSTFKDFKERLLNNPCVKKENISDDVDLQDCFKNFDNIKNTNIETTRKSKQNRKMLMISDGTV
jgi:Leucine-rich repeat (LRR) protein